MSHEYNLYLDTENFEIRVSESTQYGYFEHKDLGDNCGGGLWFENNELVGYDGVEELPIEVVTALRDHGFLLDETFD